MLPKYIDIHTHLNFAAFDLDRDEVLQRMASQKIWAINVGTQRDTSAKAVNLAKSHNGLFASVGLHPIHTSKVYHNKDELGPLFTKFTDRKNDKLEKVSDDKEGFMSRGENFDINYYRKLGSEPKVLAIGECGLDYFRIADDDPKVMEEVFRQQIELAIELDKPLMLHLRNGSSRSAYDKAFSILNSYFRIHGEHLRGNLHFFAGSINEASKFLDLGFLFSFTGVITFAPQYYEIVKYLPTNRIMAETDAPYVAPAPFRGRRNEPCFVTYVVEKIASIKGLSLEETRETLVKNAFDFFRLSTLNRGPF